MALTSTPPMPEQAESHRPIAGRVPRAAVILRNVQARELRTWEASCEVDSAPHVRTPSGVLIDPRRLTITYSECGRVEIELVGLMTDPRTLAPADPGERWLTCRLSTIQVPYWAEDFLATNWPEWIVPAVLDLAGSQGG